MAETVSSPEVAAEQGVGARQTEGAASFMGKLRGEWMARGLEGVWC